MTLTIELTPEEEAHLRSEAAARGIEAGALLRELIRQNLPAAPSAPETPRTDSEWDAAFVAWVESHDHLPALPPESFERAGFYGERG